MTERTPIAAAMRVDDVGAAGPTGLPSGTQVLTLDGALPVEHLYPGDHVVTRRGARRLLAVSKVDLSAEASIVEIAENALGGKPERATWLPAAQRVLLRDWRAHALYGQGQACVPVGQLADGEYLRIVTATAALSCYQLSFGRPEILYADGLELASADALVVRVAA